MKLYDTTSFGSSATQHHKTWSNMRKEMLLFTLFIIYSCGVKDVEKCFVPFISPGGGTVDVKHVRYLRFINPVVC